MPTLRNSFGAMTGVAFLVAIHGCGTIPVETDNEFSHNSNSGSPSVPTGTAGQPTTASPSVQGSGISAGTYTGDISVVFVARSNGELVKQETGTVSFTAVFNDQGQLLSLSDGTPLNRDDSYTFTQGNLTFTMTITSVAYFPDSALLRGSVTILNDAEPDRPAVGTFSYTFKLQSSGILGFTEHIGATTKASARYTDVLGFTFDYSGSLVK